MNKASTLVIGGLVATAACAVDLMGARAGAQNSVSDRYCKSPTTQKAVVTEMNRQRIMGKQVQRVRFVRVCTSRSPIDTSRPSPIWNEPSPSAASFWTVISLERFQVK